MTSPKLSANPAMSYYKNNMEEKRTKTGGENKFFKFIKHVKRLCNLFCFCPCGVELPPPPSRRPANPRYSVVQASEPKVATNPATVSISEIYSRYMMGHRQGYPLYVPEPDLSLSSGNRKTSIRIGDVGLVTRDGSFDFLFNVSGQYQHLNPSQLPENFKTVDSVDVAMVTHFPPGKQLFSHGVEQTIESDKLTSYRCSVSAGAILELPEGAILFGAQNKNAFKALAANNAESWYKYMALTRGRSAPNGSLYLVTGSVKSDAWGMAVFDRPSNSEDHLKFIINEVPTRNTPQSRYRWEKSGSVVSNIGPSEPSSNKEEPDPCIFLRGFKIMLRQDRWDELTESPIQQSTSKRSVPGKQDPTDLTTRQFEYDGALVTEGWGSPTSRIHPSDIVNTMLLKSNPDATVALSHDDEWCGVLPKDFAENHKNLKMDELFDNISESYKVKLENDCAFLVKARK